MNIVLIGFPSTGKSTIGRSIAYKTGLDFIDLDEQIETLHLREKATALRCRQIYQEYGKEVFLDFERRALQTLKLRHQTVLATGGGAPLQEYNRPVLKALGPVVYLLAQPETIFNRMRVKGVPQFLQAAPTVESVRELWNHRHPLYMAIADMVVSTEGQSIEQCADNIIHQLNTSPNAGALKINNAKENNHG